MFDHRVWIRCVAALCAALIVAGCDDSDGGEPFGTPTLTPSRTTRPSNTPQATATRSNTRTPTSTPTATMPPTATQTTAPTALPTQTPTVASTATPSATATETELTEPTATATVAATVTPTFLAGSCFDPEVQGAEPLCQLDVNPRPCEWLISEHCLLPYPSSFFLREDPSTPTGFRVNYALESMPANSRGTHIDPAEYNTLDGFSPGTMILSLFPQGVDLVASDVPPITDIARSLEADSPTVLIDADSGERIVHFTELDVEAGSDAVRTLIIRPEIRLQESHRYIVAIRGLKDESGAAIPPPAAFRILRDAQTTPVAAINARRDHFEDIFDRLESAGVERDELILAWDFVVASREAITSRALSARDQALAANGPGAPPFEVTSVEDNYNENIFRRIRGNYTVPLFMTKDGPGTMYNLDEQGVPRQNGTTQAPFTVIIPRSAVEPQPIPGRALIYGHGFLGRGESEITAGPQQTLARRFGFVIAATDWIGLSEHDVQHTLTMLTDISRFYQLFDRVQQGIINTIFLGRLMLDGEEGFNSHPAFQIEGVPIIDNQELYYHGNSQGGTLGALYMALTPDTERGVLGVGTANYGFLLQRSIDFATFDFVLRQHYPSDLDRMIGLALIQQIADRGEPNGYTPYLVDNPLPGTPAKKILIQTGIDDSQVNHYSVEVQVRSLGIPAMAPSAYPAFGIPEMAAPFDGSAWVPFDLNAVPLPLTNDQPAIENGVHEAVRRLDAAQLQLDAFLRPDGMVQNFCGGPCAFRDVPGVVQRSE
ncbi:MAG TPA: hypothetical protein VEB21_10255 [Terriglobales bacterium]|nr:hypothetical protein [Terriglobales bacterium]